MRYSLIRKMDISNGIGIGASLFVQGCHIRCKGCFNPETWSFDGGEEWTKEVEDKFMEIISFPYIKRVSILGGEPLAKENYENIMLLIKRIKKEYPEKTIWVYSGYTWDQIMNPVVTDDFNPKRDMWLKGRMETIKQCDVLVDGAFISKLKNLKLAFRGSSNQRLIDVQESLKENKIVLCNR